MEIHDLAVVGLAHAHVVDVADHPAFGGDLGERDLHRLDALRRRLAAGALRHLQRLDMGLDLDIGTELVGDRLFKAVGNGVRGGERQRAVGPRSSAR